MNSPSPKKPSEVLKELTIACSAEFTKWPSAGMQAWYKESLISLLLEAKGRILAERYDGSPLLTTQGMKDRILARDTGLEIAATITDLLVEEVKQS